MDFLTQGNKTTSRVEFEAVFPSIKAEVLKYVSQQNLPYDVGTRFEKILCYNTQGGKLNRGLSVPDSAQALLGRPLDSVEFKAMSTLGWLTELLQAFFLVHDDIMDNSLTRRGQQCWFRQPDVGLMAVNDAVLLESSVFLILKSQFNDHPSYVPLIEAFHEAALNTQLGQLLDMITAPEDNVDLRKFSMDKYGSIVQYKTAYYSFYLPVVLALHWLQRDTPYNLRQTREILIKMGEYFQVQDDFLDVFGDPSVTGKIGTDIQDNKCSWLINQALLLATQQQRQILNVSYGRRNEQSEIRVRQIFHELDMPGLYKDFEGRCVQEIQDMIDAVDEREGLRKEVFRVFLAKICKRSS